MSENIAIPNKKERIQYIDALRGFTMILVVFGHVEVFSFFNNGYESLLGKFFQIFRMPLFFFISGYLTYRDNDFFSFKHTIDCLKKKLFVQLVPTIIVGTLYTIYINQSFSNFLSSPYKHGYWFTIALLEMFIVYYLVRYISALLFRILKIDLFPALLFFVGYILFSLRGLFASGKLLGQMGDYGCLYETFRYFHFFVFGVVSRKFDKFFNFILKNNWINLFFIFTFTFSLFFYYKYPSLGMCSIMEIVPRYSGLILVFTYFYTYQNNFTNKSRCGAFLQFMGKRTLDIYLLHYFLLPNLHFIGTFLKQDQNIVLELILGISIALLVIVLCLVISSIIRINPILSKLLLGTNNRLSSANQ